MSLIQYNVHVIVVVHRAISLCRIPVLKHPEITDGFGQHTPDGEGGREVRIVETAVTETSCSHSRIQAYRTSSCSSALRFGNEAVFVRLSKNVIPAACMTLPEAGLSG